MAYSLRESLRDNMKVSGVQTPADALLQKWRPQLNIIREALGDKFTEDRAMTTAVLMENTSRRVDANVNTRRLFEAIQTADVSYQKEFAINNLMAVYPNLIMPELVSIQPMLSEIGKIVYLRATYGSDKGRFRKGDTMMSNFNLGNHAGDSTYSSDMIEGEVLPDDTATNGTNFSWVPIEPGSIYFTDPVGTVTHRDDGNGNIMPVAGGTAAFTIKYETGALAPVGSPPAMAGFSTNYTYGNMDIPVQVPDLDIKLVSNPIQARSRKLKVTYSIDASNFMSNDYGISIPAEALALSSAELKREMDDEVITDLATLGTAPGTSFDATIPDGVSLVDHYAGFPAALVEASNNIWNTTQVAQASWAILGPQAANIVEAIPRFKSSGVMGESLVA